MQDLSTIDSHIAKAIENFGNRPTIDTMRFLAWEYKRLLQYYAENYDEKSIVECIECINSLGYRENSFELAISRLMIAILFNHRDGIRSFVMDLFFDYIIGIHPVNDSGFHRSLLSGFTLNSRVWPSYPDFCEWWGFANFNDSDFVVSNNGFALGSSAYLAYSRAILKSSISPLTITFWADFASKMAVGAFSIYANLQIAEFLIRIRFCLDSILCVLRPLVIQKFRKPWVWLTVADAFCLDDLRAKACLFFALRCTQNVQDSRNYVVYFRLAQYFKAVSDIENCKYFINKLRALDVYRDEIEQDFHNYVDSVSRIFVADADSNYQQICHDIFAEISNPDPDFWIRLSEDIKKMGI